MLFSKDKLIPEISGRVQQRYQELGKALGAASTQENGHGSLQGDLELLIGVANGEFSRSDVMVRQVEEALSRVLSLLLGNALKASPTFHEGFWQTEIGIVVSRARWWISVDDLITISNAAALAFGENTQANRMRIARAIDNGALEWVPDPSVVNPMQNKRVLRSQVERLRELRRLPE
jgi:hypothetical protein